jgi:hypothetical protein
LIARKQEASPHPVDIGFVLNGGEDLNRRDRNKAKQFLASVATTLDVEMPNSRAALLQYTETVDPVVTFTNYEDMKKFYNDLHLLPINQGRNQIDLAIRETSKQIFSFESRAPVSRLAVLLTFGNALNIQQAKTAAVELSSKEVKLFIVHVGSKEEMASLNQLVSNDKIFHARTIDGLMDLVIPLHNKIVAESGNHQTHLYNNIIANSGNNYINKEKEHLCSFYIHPLHFTYFSADSQRTFFRGHFLFNHTRAMDSSF